MGQIRWVLIIMNCLKYANNGNTTLLSSETIKDKSVVLSINIFFLRKTCDLKFKKILLKITKVCSATCVRNPKKKFPHNPLLLTKPQFELYFKIHFSLAYMGKNKVLR